jgi:hypothetical protein
MLSSPKTPSSEDMRAPVPRKNDTSDDICINIILKRPEITYFHSFGEPRPKMMIDDDNDDEGKCVYTGDCCLRSELVGGRKGKGKDTKA